MYRYLAAFVLFLSMSGWADGQILPKEGSHLNYRLVGFSFPYQKISGTRCTIEIARGNFNKEDSFSKNIVKNVDANSAKMIVELPYFGVNYTWRTVVAEKGKIPMKSSFHHFITDIVPNVDTTVNRVRVIKSADKYKDAVFLLDGTLTMYDMKGNPLWYLPVNEELNTTGDMETRDMNLSPEGTITFMNKQIFEVDYNANILWKGPVANSGRGGAARENFHHEFTRLKNGHYMVLGFEFVYWDTRQTNKLALVSEANIGAGRADTNFRRIRLGTINEYDGQGKEIWSWHGMQYFNGSDIFYHMMPDGSHNLLTHDNAFYFDEKEGAIYISYKNISRVVKIKYPEGTTINSYGEIYAPGIPEAGNGLFCSQHCCRVDHEGNLFLFNNNECKPGETPSIVVMKQPKTPKEKLSKLWEYVCPIEEADKKDSANYIFRTGGSVQELPDGEIFSSMSTEYSKLFIVNKNKEVLWSAMPEKWSPRKNAWERIGSFKANMICSRKELEKLVWSSEKGK